MGTADSNSLLGYRTRFQSVWHHRQRAQTDTGCVKDSISNSGREADHGTFTCPGRGKIFAVKQNCFQNGHVTESWYAVLRQSSIEDLSVFEFDGFKQRAAESLYV